MRFRDTTTPFTPRRHATIYAEENAPTTLLQSQTLHFELISLYYSDAGPQWSSHGRAEGDCFHHIDLTIHSDAWVSQAGRERLELRPGQAYFFPAITPIIRECPKTFEILWLRFRCSCLSGLDPLRL